MEVTIVLTIVVATMDIYAMIRIKCDKVNCKSTLSNKTNWLFVYYVVK